MSRPYLIEKSVSEQFKSLSAIPEFGLEAVRLGETDPCRLPLISKIVFKTGSPADIPTDGILDFVCLAGIGKFQIEVVEVFRKIKQVLRLGGRCCLLVASDLDSFIYYGMENGFDYIKSETIEIRGAMYSLVRNSLTGTLALFFTFSGSEWSAERESQICADGKKKIMSIWFIRN